MTEDALSAEILDEPKRREATFARAVSRCREAAGRGGSPDAAWSMGEKLLIALVFRSPEQLEVLGYSEAEANDRLRYDFGVTSDKFPKVLDQIRSEL